LHIGGKHRGILCSSQLGCCHFRDKSHHCTADEQNKAIERTAALLLSHVKTIAAMVTAIMSHPMMGNILKTPRANPELLCIRVSPKCDREMR